MCNDNVRSKFNDFFVKKTLTKFHEFKYYQGIKYSMSSELKVEEDKQDESSGPQQYEVIALLQGNIVKLYEAMNSAGVFEEERTSIRKFMKDSFSIDVDMLPEKVNGVKTAPQVSVEKANDESEEEVISLKKTKRGIKGIETALSKAKVVAVEKEINSKVLGKKRSRKGYESPVVEVSEEDIPIKKPKRAISKDKLEKVDTNKKTKSTPSGTDITNKTAKNNRLKSKKENKHEEESDNEEVVETKATRGRKKQKQEDSPISKLASKVTPTKSPKTNKQQSPIKATTKGKHSPPASCKPVKDKTPPKEDKRSSRTSKPESPEIKSPVKATTPEKKQKPGKSGKTDKAEKEEQTTPEFNKASPVKSSPRKSPQVETKRSRRGESSMIEDEVDLIITPKKANKGNKNIKKDSSADNKSRKSTPRDKVSSFDLTEKASAKASAKPTPRLENNITPLKRRTEQKSPKKNSSDSKNRLLGRKKIRIHEDDNRIQGNIVITSRV
jgi:hypothetical protein